jgi:hypothetical protein
VFGASAFRGSSHGLVGAPSGHYVSCSGGPCPCIPVEDLTYVGRTTQRFWRWHDIPRAGGGEDFELEVNLWSWKGERS